MIWPEAKVVSCSLPKAGCSSVRNLASKTATGKDVPTAYPVRIQSVVAQEPTSSHLGRRRLAAGLSQAAGSQCSEDAGRAPVPDGWPLRVRWSSASRRVSPT